MVMSENRANRENDKFVQTPNGNTAVRVSNDDSPVGGGRTLLYKTGSASATFTLVAAVSGKRIKVYSIDLITAATTAVTVTFKDGGGGTVMGTYPLQALTGTNFGVTKSVPPPASLFGTTAGSLLELAFSTSQTVTYNISYFADDST